jgi:hypothetical protein
MSFLVLFYFDQYLPKKNSLFDIIIFSLNKSLCWNPFLRGEGTKVEKPHVDLPECSSFYFFSPSSSHICHVFQYFFHPTSDCLSFLTASERKRENFHFEMMIQFICDVRSSNEVYTPSSDLLGVFCGGEWEKNEYNNLFR